MTTNVFKYSLGGALLLVALIAAAVYFIAPPREATAMPGHITGSTSYPSEGTPAEIVCAEPVHGGASTCVETPGQGLTPEAGDTTYDLKLVPGDYYVYAKVKDPASLGSDLGGYKAYYTTFVTCGEQFSCKDHAKIPVTVVGGQTVSGIDPADWYMP